jgi:hypothetical protein
VAEGAGRGVSRDPRKFYEGLVEELIAFGKHQFWLGQRLEDGATRREHLESAARQGIPTQIEGPQLPDTVNYLWKWFCEIHDGRTLSGMGPNRANHMDLMAWQWNTGNKLASWELRAIRDLGGEWIAAQQDVKQNTAPKPGKR